MGRNRLQHVLIPCTQPPLATAEEKNPGIIVKDSKKQVMFSYVQGMNVLLAPFLYVMPSELEAFHCFCRFIEVGCPTYVQPSLSGVHKGLEVRKR
jgi:cell cycle arrest protein BUB2